MGCLRGRQINKNITIRISYNTNYEKKPRRRVTPESSLVVGSTGPSSSGTVASLLLPRSSGGTRRKCLPVTTELEGECLLIGGFLTLAIWAPWRQDREVCQIRLHPNHFTARQQIVILMGDGARWTWANTIVIHLHVLGLALSWRGIRGWSCGTL